MKSLSSGRKKDGDSNKIEISRGQVTSFTDITEFKSIIKVMEVLQPVKDIRQFKDLDAKY
jgi:hypothetical protein